MINKVCPHFNNNEEFLLKFYFLFISGCLVFEDRLFCEVCVELERFLGWFSIFSIDNLQQILIFTVRQPSNKHYEYLTSL